MNSVALSDDLRSLAAQHPGLAELVQRIEAASSDFSTQAPLLAEAGRQAHLGLYGTLALLLKADWRSHSLEPGRWCPWLAVERLREPLGNAVAEMAAPEFELLVLEQCTLSCHLVGYIETVGLARRHATEHGLLATGSAEEREAFLADKRSWLHDELQLDYLLVLRQDLVGELESTRMRYLTTLGQPLADYVEAAHRVTLMRYRCALDDPTLTMEELSQRLQLDLVSADAAAAQVALEPELRQALFDTVRDVQGDLQALQRLQSLWSNGHARLASDEDRRHAAQLFRELARLIHPDALAQHEDFADMAPANRERLKDIWHQASATHGRRAFLSHDKLVNYVEHLQDWINEAGHILRSMAFHAPSRLLSGNTLGHRQTDLRRATDHVRRYLHAVRDDIAQLEFDPQHAEYRRVIAMGDAELATERDRMTAQMSRWNEEARRLSMQLVARHAATDDPGGSNRPEHRP